MNLLNPFLWFFVATCISLANDAALQTRGESVRGTIQSVTLDHPGKGPDDYLVNYSYDKDFKSYTGQRSIDLSKGAGLKPSDNITVLLLPDRPTVNAPNFFPQNGSQASELTDMTNRDHGTVLLLGIAILLIECFIWVVPLKHRYIVRNGVGTRGNIESKDFRTGSKGEKYYSVRYSYRDATNHRDVQTKMGVSEAQYNSVHMGDEVTVVYLPKREGMSVIYNFSYYEVKP